MKTFGLAITSYERVVETRASFSLVVDDPRVDAITVVDDHSGAALFAELEGAMAQWPKIRVYQNESTLGCYQNKRMSVEWSSSEWTMLLDSDNTIDGAFVDALCAQPWDPDTLYLPVFGGPALDYRAYEGLHVTRENAASLIDSPLMSMALNTGNFFAHRETYLTVFDKHFDPAAADSLYFVYCWLMSGRRALFTPGLRYQHLVHAGYWTQHAVRSTEVAGMLVQKIRGWACAA